MTSAKGDGIINKLFSFYGIFRHIENK